MSNPLGFSSFVLARSFGNVSEFGDWGGTEFQRGIDANFQNLSLPLQTAESPNILRQLLSFPPKLHYKIGVDMNKIIWMKPSEPNLSNLVFGVTYFGSA